MEGNTIVQRFGQLESDRKPHDHTLQLIERFVAPFRNEFFQPLSTSAEVNWRNRPTWDATAVWANSRLSSFIHSSLIPPAVRWFTLKFRDAAVNEDKEVMEWTDETNGILWQALRESDFSGEAGSTLFDLTSFGTNILLGEEKDDQEWKGMDYTSCPLMDSYFEMGGDSKVSRVYFLKRYTNLMLRERFPDISEEELTDEGSTDSKKEVILCIYHRDLEEDVDIHKQIAPEARPIGYKWVMRGTGNVVEEGGYYYMPATVTRWDRTAGSDYGYSPSNIALGHIVTLNEFVAQISEAASKAIDPSFWTTARGVIGDLDNGPGSLVDVKKGPIGQEFGVLHEVSNFPAGEKLIERIVADILHIYAVDLLDLKDTTAMTAYEVRARLDRIMRQYAPVLGKLEPTLLAPTVENMFHSMLRMKKIPDIPEAARGKELDIEFTAPMARAQRNEDAQAIQIFVQNTMNNSQVRPEVLDMVDWDEVTKADHELYSVPAKILNSKKEVAAIRLARKQQEEAMVEAEGIRMGGEAMKAAGEGVKSVQDAGGSVEAN